MTRLHSIVIPAAVVVLATATPGADARGKPVILPTDWAAVCEPVPRAVERAGEDHPRATTVELMAKLPLAGLLPTASAAAAPGGTQAAPAASAGDHATGGAVAHSARGPPPGPAHAAGG